MVFVGWGVAGERGGWRVLGWLGRLSENGVRGYDQVCSLELAG